MTVMTRIEDLGTRTGPVPGLCGKATLRTPCGGRHVENVRVGDLVVTRDSGLKPVRMIWTRTFSASETDADPSLAPVRLKQRAIGPMMPQRDLLVSPGQRVLVPGYRLADVPDTQMCLLTASDIAGASDEAYTERAYGEVTYYNLVFDKHQVFCVDGLPVESYLPSEDAVSQLDEKLRRDITQIFGDIGSIGAGDPAYYPPEPTDFRPEFV